MGNPKAFLTVPRQEAGYRPVHDRIMDFSEVEQTLNTSERKPGIAVHGLWGTFLPLGMSVGESSSGVPGCHVQGKMERSL